MVEQSNVGLELHLLEPQLPGRSDDTRGLVTWFPAAFYVGDSTKDVLGLVRGGAGTAAALYGLAAAIDYTRSSRQKCGGGNGLT